MTNAAGWKNEGYRQMRSAPLLEYTSFASLPTHTLRELGKII